MQGNHKGECRVLGLRTERKCGPASWAGGQDEEGEMKGRVGGSCPALGAIGSLRSWDGFKTGLHIFWHSSHKK